MSADGRYFGHLPYREVANDALAGDRADAVARQIVPAAPRCRRLALPADHRRAGRRASRLRLISCFRTRAHQEGLFCRPELFGACRDPAERARSVAPGGYSEHITGYTIDFGTGYEAAT